MPPGSVPTPASKPPAASGDDEGEPTRETLVDIPPPEPTPRTCGLAHLVEIYGPQLGRRIELRDGDVVCGRDEDCELPLDDDTVSRRHAVLRWTEEGRLLEDLGSTNGTLLNRRVVARALVGHGDEIKIGRSIFKFLCAGTAEAHYHEVSYRLMTRDGLTHAWNRYAFDEAVEREVSRARRYARPLGLIALDLDHFKQVNDTAGHMAGDELLRQVADLVSAAVRREDVFARTGGEEFAVLVPEGTLERCRAEAERLRTLLEQARFEILGRDLRITGSFGVAELDPQTDRDGSALRRLADARLYAAKDAGRNRVVADGAPRLDGRA